MASDGARELAEAIWCRNSDADWPPQTKQVMFRTMCEIDSALSPLVEALREILGCPATFADERVSYEERQIDTATLENARAVLARWSPSTQEKP